MKRIMLTNVYPMDHAFELWKQGEYPGHHLWGCLSLLDHPDYELLILKHERFKIINQLGKYIGFSFLDQQIRLLFCRKKFDILFAPYAAANTRFLVVLKALGIISFPIVIVAHQPIMQVEKLSFFMKFLIKRILIKYDSVIFISEQLKSNFIKALNFPPNICTKFHSMSWGPDMSFYKKFIPPRKFQETEFAMSAGHTGRDFEIIIEAFRKIDFPLRIYCTNKSRPNILNMPANVTVYSRDSTIPYKDLLKEYDKARVILIPLKEKFNGTEGLTSLLDSIAMGKPVVMTRNINIDINIDKSGIGRTVNGSDLKCWISLLSKMLFDFTALDEMSRNNLSIMVDKINLNNFSDQLQHVFRTIRD